MNISVTITKDEVTPAIADRLAKTRPGRVANILRQPLETFTRVHLAANGTNKKGWPSTGFWEDASRSTIGEVADNGVLLRVQKIGVRQRFYGGTINPAKAKALAIPISPVSYGHLPREFPGLFLLVTKKGAYLVQRNQGFSAKTGKLSHSTRQGGNAGRRLGSELTFLFKLSGGVNQKPDPSVIPSNDEYTEVAMAAIERSLN